MPAMHAAAAGAEPPRSLDRAFPGATPHHTVFARMTFLGMP